EVEWTLRLYWFMMFWVQPLWVTALIFSGHAHKTSADTHCRAPSIRLRPEERYWRRACLLIAPYFLLGIALLVTQPPVAPPDESDHLVKALGIAKFDIGSRYEFPPAGDDPALSRNASILTGSRVVNIPARLNPAGFSCFAFKALQAADCLPSASPMAAG